MDDGREYDFGPGDAHVVSAGHDAWVEGDEPCVALDLAFTGRALAGHVGRCPCGVEFRVASDDQLGQLVAAIHEHARSSHGHELTTQQVLAEVMSWSAPTCRAPTCEAGWRAGPPAPPATAQLPCGR